MTNTSKGMGVRATKRHFELLAEPSGRVVWIAWTPQHGSHLTFTSWVESDVPFRLTREHAALFAKWLPRALS